MSDPVHHPVHYANSPAKCLGCGRSIECIDVAEHWGFNLGNALKYLWRAGKKGSPESDLVHPKANRSLGRFREGGREQGLFHFAP